MTVPNLLLGQGNEQYLPINKIGWDMTNFLEPENLTESDSGEVNYLLTISKNGKIKDVRVLSNSFSKETEIKWRNAVRKLILIRQSSHIRTVGYKGTLQISRRRCIDSSIEISN